MLRRILKTWRRPRFRFEQAPLIHVLRVGGAFFVCLLIAALFPNPHSIWMLISVLAVMGSIQYTGSIVEKVWQRALGTLVGGLGGILAVLADRFVSPWGCAALELVVAVTASYLSIGRLGYMALVSGITMVMVANSGDLHIALWRILNVALGVGVAQLFAYLVPSRASEHWFFLLGENLRDEYLLYHGLAHGHGLARERQEAVLLRGQKLRALLSSASSEAQVASTRLEGVLHAQRSVLALLEVMADESDAQAVEPLSFEVRGTFLRSLARFDLPAPNLPDEGWRCEQRPGHWLEPKLLRQLAWLDAELQQLLPALVDWPGLQAERYSIGKSK